MLSDETIVLTVVQYVRINAENVPYVVNGYKKRNFISGMMFRKNIIKEIGYFKPAHISEDSEYHERFIAVFGKTSRKIIHKVLYYALFSIDSLLFSNANVRVSKNKIEYKITGQELGILNSYRTEHKKIKNGELSPYQSFEVNDEITTRCKQ